MFGVSCVNYRKWKYSRCADAGLWRRLVWRSTLWCSLQILAVLMLFLEHLTWLWSNYHNPCHKTFSELCSFLHSKVAEVSWTCTHRGVFLFPCLSSSRNIPNRYTFPCPYCPEKNFDQEGLVEHCKLSHSTDTKSVVRVTFFFNTFYGKKSDLWKKLQE